MFPKTDYLIKGIFFGGGGKNYTREVMRTKDFCAALSRVKLLVYSIIIVSEKEKQSISHNGC